MIGAFRPSHTSMNLKLMLRFGPDVVQWKAKTVKDYIYTGLLHSIGFYVVSAGFMLILSG